MNINNTEIHIFSTASLPPISYMYGIIHSDNPVIDIGEHYIKQSYRNRFRLPGPNGVQDLIVPVKNTHIKTCVKDIMISYDMKWQITHWRAIETIYNKSPYFIYYSDELKNVFMKKHKYLIDFNTETLDLIAKFLSFTLKPRLSSDYIDTHDAEDLKNIIHPKNKSNLLNLVFPEYTQVFITKQGFIKDMSIIDLIFNLGPDALNYIKSLKE